MKKPRGTKPGSKRSYRRRASSQIRLGRGAHGAPALSVAAMQIDRILRSAALSTYDFRTWAYPDDPLKDRWESWVPYYRLKWAIAGELCPRTILEIGVRYGYSIRAFLAGAFPVVPQVLGVDKDDGSYGGQVGALAWARTQLGAYATFLHADSQTMPSFPHPSHTPDGIYDLVHIDGQQDHVGTVNDGRKALRQARYVLIDGYFWTPENFAGANELLWLDHERIAWTLMIPGYAGELLIRTLLL
jgi:hypothetical protein